MTILSHTFAVDRPRRTGKEEAARTEDESLLTLGRDRLFVLRDARGTRVLCLSGSLWVTEDARLTDLVLRPGEHFVVAHNGMVLLMALDASTFRVVKPADAGLIQRLANGISKRLRSRREDEGGQ